ncbi:VanW family protein [Cyanobium sp. ATX-6F1]|uniref:VanW family protein n=1 Tax=Cyanobium sp. ATX-6F1 TaxID=3137388 RepID=UPI0039BDB8A0
MSRRLLSQRHPFLYRASVAFHRLRRRLRARFDGRTYCTVASVGAEPLPYRIKKHQSLLMRKLGSTDLRLQHNKVDNLRLVVANLDGVLLRPGETFSFCQLVGKPSRRRGFKEGVELSFGVARPGIGGGICQSTNLLYWLALHAELTISERHHHTCDPFPDEGRVLPWSSGAAVFYNYLDFQLTNPTPSTFQIRLWLTDTHLVGSCAAIGNLPSSSTSTRRTIAFSRARTPTSAATRSGAAP